MKEVVILDCCGHEVKTNSKTYEYIDCFKTTGKFFKKKLKDGRPVKREMLLVAVCPKCNHWILKYLWYSKSTGRFQDWDDSKIIRGKQADEVYRRRVDDYTMVDIPNPFKPKADGKQSKKIPWVYFKSQDGYSQIPRYIDETQDAGLKVVCPIKTIN